MHNLPIHESYDTDVPVPDDGVDFRTAASLYGALQALANRAAYLKGVLFGTVFPVSDLLIHAALHVTGTFVTSGIAQFGGAVEMFSTLTVDAFTHLQSLTVSGAVIHQSTTTLVDATTCGDLAAGGTCSLGTSLTDTVTVWGTTRQQGPLTVFNTTDFKNAVLFEDDVALHAPIVCSSAGRIVRPAAVGPQSGSGTLDTAVANCYWFPTLTADVSMTIADKLDGDYLEIATVNANYWIHIYDPSSNLIGSLKNLSPNASSAKLIRIAGVWQFFTVGYNP